MFCCETIMRGSARVNLKTDSPPFWGKRSRWNPDQSGADKIDNHRPEQGCRNFECTKNESRLEQPALRFFSAPWIDIDFLPARGANRHQNAYRHGRSDPEHRLLSKRAPDLPRKI
jgi:hypothetical protein